MSPEPDPALVTVRHSKTTSIGVTAVGGAMLLTWIIRLIADEGAMWPLLILGLFLTYAGINTFYRPFCVYDTATGTAVFPAIFGSGTQEFGGAKGEMIETDGKRLKRIGYDGKVRPLSTLTSDRADMARMLAAMAAPVSEDRWKRRERRRA